MRTFQFKWLKINPTFVTFLADFVLLKEYIKSLKVHVELPQKFVEMCGTKSSSSHKKLSFNAFLDCYQISHLHSWVHAENCCTCIDKIHSKTKVFIIIFLWNLYSNYYHKCRACIPNFKPIQIDLIIQLWLSSQLTQIFNKGQILSNWAILYRIESNLMSVYLNKLTRHISNHIPYWMSSHDHIHSN